MVEYNLELDNIFLSLADATRRDILRLLRAKPHLSISEIASHYSLTFAAISKHLKVLEKAHLVTKTREGKQQIVSLSPTAFKEANDYIQKYERVWNERFDRLDALLKEDK